MTADAQILDFRSLHPPRSAQPAPAAVDVESAAAYRLPEIPWLRLGVTLVAREPARLPAYQGSMLRGAFGHALRRAVCAMGPHQDCGGCRLRRLCAYGRLYEPRIEGPRPPFSGGLTTAPRPYVFEPRFGEGESGANGAGDGDDDGGGGARQLAAGEPLAFDLLLFGRAIELAPYAELALARMGEGGLGAGRARFRLERLERASGLTPATSHEEAAAAGSDLTLHLLTPLRVRAGERLETAFSFRRLAFLALRRTLEMAWYHVPEAATDWHFRPLLEAAGRVRLDSTGLRWHAWSRWSNRQRASLPMGGLVGTARLCGDLAPFRALLAAGETLHLGKATTLGLGRVRVSRD